jgi:hypothetical protein
VTVPGRLRGAVRPHPSPRQVDQRGIASSLPVALVSLAVVSLAGVALVADDIDDPSTGTAVAVGAASSEQPAPSRTSRRPSPDQRGDRGASEPSPEREPKKPQVRRAEVYVEVYNNSGISGLAASTAAEIASGGWQVVGSDNWYGTISASTVYYPERLRAAATMLGKDLGIQRLQPAIAPMRLDRLTVILTTDYA